MSRDDNSRRAIEEMVRDGKAQAERNGKPLTTEDEVRRFIVKEVVEPAEKKRSLGEVGKK
jgi:hypothetical protein